MDTGLSRDAVFPIHSFLCGSPPQIDFSIFGAACFAFAMHVADTENTSDTFPADLISVPAAPCTVFFI